MKRLGLVGGISWVSTIDYYRYINEGINAELGGLQFADCLMYSINFGALQERGWNHSLPMLLDACQRLQAGGAEGIVLCANTAHLHADMIRAEIPLPLIHIVDATVVEVQRRELKTVGVLGTKFTMESDLYGKGLRDAGIEALVPDRQESRDRIQQTLKEELGRNVFREETKAFYLQEMIELRERGAEGILMACTEIPLLIHQDNFDRPLFDTTRIHAQAAVRFALT